MVITLPCFSHVGCGIELCPQFSQRAGDIVPLPPKKSRRRMGEHKEPHMNNCQRRLLFNGASVRVCPRTRQDNHQETPHIPHTLPLRFPFLRHFAILISSRGIHPEQRRARRMTLFSSFDPFCFFLFPLFSTHSPKHFPLYPHSPNPFDHTFE